MSVQSHLLRWPEKYRALLRSGGLGASSLGEEGCERCFISSVCLVIRGQEDPTDSEEFPGPTGTLLHICCAGCPR